jgi:4-amino-4-deoxy-L-arabinose transferase-like glycosyltransferase
VALVEVMRIEATLARRATLAWSRASRRHAAPAALVGLIGVYALQVATPLRLTGDSVVYLTMARSLATGHGVPHGSLFPPGLPGVYAALDLAGIHRSWAIVAFNVLLAGLAVGCTIYLYRRVLSIGALASTLLGCASLLSYVLAKHAALALSDVPFLGVASAALVLLTLAGRDRTGRRWLALAGGVVLVAAAIALRTAGIVLAPPVLLAVVNAARAGLPLGNWLRTRSAALTAVACAGACAALGVVVSGSRYLDTASSGYGDQSGASLLADHLRNLGEVAVNVPETRLPHALHRLLLPAGIVALALIVSGLWRLRRALEPAHAYVLGYVVLVLVWPFVDARFWLPIVPLALGYAFVAVRPLLGHRAVLAAAVAYATLFAVLGLGSLGYDTRLSFSGASFPNRYGRDVAGTSLQPTYRVAFGQARPGDLAKVQAAALAVLRHWEPRAHRR